MRRCAQCRPVPLSWAFMRIDALSCRLVMRCCNPLGCIWVARAPRMPTVSVSLLTRDGITWTNYHSTSPTKLTASRLLRRSGRRLTARIAPNPHGGTGAVLGTLDRGVHGGSAPRPRPASASVPPPTPRQTGPSSSACRSAFERTSPTAKWFPSVGCATQVRPAVGASRSTAPATTTVRTTSSPAVTRPAAEKKHDCACGLYITDRITWPPDPSPTD
jgi:hypothetical protein